MTKFAFVIHPLKAKHLARKYPIAAYFPDSWLEAYMIRSQAKMASEITGIRSITGAETQGWFIGCPLTPDMMLNRLPLDEVYARIARCTQIAGDLGAELIGLGAFTSVVGDGGLSIAAQSPIAVTTGNSYTVATAIEGTLTACELLGVDISDATLAVVGATGSIGKTCARVLARSFKHTILVGRDEQRTREIASEIPGAIGTTDVSLIKAADAVVTVTSAGADIILPEHLKPGAIVCDVARPRDVSVRVAKERQDVLVIEGGVVRVPGNVNFNFDFGFPDHTAYACMSETMILALENRPEPYTLGKEVTVEQVDEMTILAKKHGFELAGFRSFEKAVPEAAIERARDAVVKGRKLIAV